MNCPLCKTSLTKLNTEAAELDYCTSCKGVWFDEGELKKFDNPQELLPQSINLPASTPTIDYSAGARKCPRCTEAGLDAIMCRRSIDIHDTVEVDQCLTCSGIWLDGGEIAAVRGLYPSEEARKQVEDSWLNAKLEETEENIASNIGVEMKQIEANKKTLSYRMMKALSDLFDQNAFD